jgi:CxxC motif-containing protein
VIALSNAEQSITLTCVNCPAGCRLNVVRDGDQIVSVEGYRCRQGIEYAHQEVMNPSRIVTSLIRVSGSSEPLSVKTKQPIPRHLTGDCLAAIQASFVTLPVTIGDVIIENVLNTGVDVIATRSLPDRTCRSAKVKA